MDSMVKILNYYADYFNTQKGRKYPVSNQIVRCAVFAEDKNKAFSYIQSKNPVKIRETYTSLEGILENGERWIWLSPKKSCKGFRAYKIAVDESISKDVFFQVILPMCTLYCCSMEII